MHVMKIAILASGKTIHTVRWCNALSNLGHDVHLITAHRVSEDISSEVHVHELLYPPPLGYILNARELARILRKLSPDILNVHYASGYGTLGRLVNYEPWILSVWGSDVYDFALRSRVNEFIVRGNLRRATAIGSTSHAMAAQTRAIYEPKDLFVTPFGIDCELFAPRADDSGREIVIGTVKKLAPHYGVDTLIRAFATVRSSLREQAPHLGERLQLHLVGDGPQREELVSLARELGVEDVCQFTGRVPHEQVPKYLNRFDIYVALSRRESFGVAILEAGACGVPVIVSDAGGLPEVVIDGETGVVVPQDDVRAAASALISLIRTPERRERMGHSARRHVFNNYAWDACVERMLDAYRATIDLHGRRHEKVEPSTATTALEDI